MGVPFFGEEMLMFWFWCPSGFGPQIVRSRCLLLLPCFPLPWGGVHRRDDFLFLMTMMRTTDARRGEFCSGVFAVFLSFDCLGAFGPRNDSSRMSSPRYGTASCSAPTSRRGFPPPPPSPPPFPLFYFFFSCASWLSCVELFLS